VSGKESVMSREINLYSYYDMKNNLYDTPFWAQNDLMAERSFKLQLLKEGSLIAEFKNDFRLEQIAKFDPITGEVVQVSRVIIDGSQLKKGEY
jgi:hypothetical protein